MSVQSLYQSLFGKGAPKDSGVTDFAEHGRVGGLSTEQGFKFVSIVGGAVRVNENSGDSNIEYVGKAKIGASTSDAVWQIKKINSTTGTIITWADTDDNYNNIYDNREALSYG